MINNQAEQKWQETEEQLISAQAKYSASVPSIKVYEIADIQEQVRRASVEDPAELVMILTSYPKYILRTLQL